MYLANTSMEKKAFCNNDGDMLILPQQGRLDIQTEFGRYVLKVQKKFGRFLGPFLTTMSIIIDSWWDLESCALYNVGWSSRWTYWISFAEYSFILVATGHPSRWSLPWLYVSEFLNGSYLKKSRHSRNIRLSLCPSRAWPIRRQWPCQRSRLRKPSCIIWYRPESMEQYVGFVMINYSFT